MCKRFFIFFIAISFSLIAQENMIYEKGAFHEAFLSQEYGTLIYKMINDAPPKVITERPPPRPENEEGEMQWIGGYWEWSDQLEEFFWVSGLWRLPPPGYHWNEGEWKQVAEGWVRLPGFWHRENIQYFQQIPPDAIDEYIPPAPGENYFWILGHFEFDATYQRFDWRQGRWQPFDVRWVYMPGHHLWRPEGYFFTESYWDWPIEKRGEIYASILIPSGQRESFIYEPTVKVALAHIVAHYFPDWPNYLYFYHSFVYMHPEFWDQWGVHVPWWPWQEWWCFTWQDQLWLFWWWTHPEYPEPPWMTLRLSKEIVPPTKGIKKLMQLEIPLPNITPNGIVGNEKILKATQVPYVSEKNLETIKNELMPQNIRRPVLLPEGKEAPVEKPIKPTFGPKEESLARPPERTPLLLLPKEKLEPPEPPKTMRYTPPPFPHSNSDETPWPKRYQKIPEMPHSNVDGPKWPEQEEREKKDEKT